MAIKKSVVFALAFALIFFILAHQVSAQKITGRIGNSRMVLSLQTGESVRKSILIMNVNDVPLNVNVSTAGDLADSIKLDEKSFTLSPGEEKKLYFTIKAKDEGTTESKINVLFTPQSDGTDSSGKSGVGLSSTIIVIASGESVSTEDDSEITEDQTSEDKGFSFIPKFPSGASVSGEDSSTSGGKLSPLSVLIISTTILVLVFIVLMIYASRAKSKKRLTEPRE